MKRATKCSTVDICSMSCLVVGTGKYFPFSFINSDTKKIKNFSLYSLPLATTENRIKGVITKQIMIMIPNIEKSFVIQLPNNSIVANNFKVIQ
jgi:hypothetical protein